MAAQCEGGRSHVPRPLPPLPAHPAGLHWGTPVQDRQGNTPHSCCHQVTCSPHTQSLDIMEAIHSLQALEMTRSCAFFVQQLFCHRRQVCFSLPAFHNTAAKSSLALLASVAAVLSSRATLKHIVKTMHATGLLPSNYGAPVGRGRVQLGADESWVTGSVAFSQLQNG